MKREITPKVWFDYQIFSLQSYGGISRYFVELVKQFLNSGTINPVVLPFLHRNEYLHEIPTSDVYGAKIPKFNFRGSGRLLGSINKSFQAAFELLDRADIIHMTYYGSSSLQIRKTKRVITVYDMIHEKYSGIEGLKQIDKGFLQQKKRRITDADLIFCISDSTKRDLMSHIDIPHNKIVTSHLAASPIFQRDPRVGRENFVLFVGNRQWYKNFNRFLLAFKKSDVYRHWPLICFGGGAFTTEENQLISDLGLEKHIRLISGDDFTLRKLYQTASLFVFPSLYEGFGIPLLEAMACGCPVACSNTSSFPEVAGHAASYFDPVDVSDMARAIATTISDQSVLYRMTIAGEIQSKNFSWERCAEITTKGYLSLMGA